jgi:hypothetical protein
LFSRFEPVQVSSVQPGKLGELILRETAGRSEFPNLRSYLDFDVLQYLSVWINLLLSTLLKSNREESLVGSEPAV